MLGYLFLLSPTLSCLCAAAESSTANGYGIEHHLNISLDGAIIILPNYALKFFPPASVSLPPYIPDSQDEHNKKFQNALIKGAFQFSASHAFMVFNGSSPPSLLCQSRVTPINTI